jgi:hypothetical protein
MDGLHQLEVVILLLGVVLALTTIAVLISDDVLHRLEHELDIEAIRLGIGERRGGAIRTM